MSTPTETPSTDHPQLLELVAFLRDVLGEGLIGAYLFGSAILTGLRTHSDIDVMAVVDGAMGEQQNGHLIGKLLQLSGHPRHLELTIVVQSDIRPWRYPPRMDFQYGDWWRHEFENGDLHPWDGDTNPDLASLIRMVLSSSVTLVGPPPARVFDPVPRKDYVTAALHGIDGLLDEVDTDTRNVILTLARTWHGIVTDQIASKDAAAQWVLDRLPEQYRWVLAEARAIYRGEQREWSADPVSSARSYAHYVAEQIRGLPDPSK